MSRRRAALAGAGAVGLAVLFVRHAVLPGLIIDQMMVGNAGDDRTPTDLGLAYEDASFVVDGNRLQAWLVSPTDPKPVAFLLFHGDGESVSDFLHVQRLLHDRGYPSLVYDYGGFGRSEGGYSRRIFDEEPRAAWDTLLGLVDEESSVVIVGHSFGAAVFVEALHDMETTRLAGVVFNSGPPALRDILHEVLGVPAPVTWLLPNLVNARQDIADFNVPVLVIASEADEVVPYHLTLRVYEAADQPKRLLLLVESDHNELVRANPQWWQPIFDWLETG